MMTHAVDRLTEKQVAHHAVAVRADDQEINRVARQMTDQLARRIGTVQIAPRAP